MTKLGLIVEGTTDEVIISTLLHKMFAKVKFTIIAVHGASRLHAAFVTVYKFLRGSYPHIFVLFDTDTTDLLEIEDQMELFGRQFRTHRLEDYVTLVPVVPQIEAWLLAEFEEMPELVADPKAALKQHLQCEPLSVACLQQLAETIDPETIAERSPSFARFVQQVEQVLLNLDELVLA